MKEKNATLNIRNNIRENTIHEDTKKKRELACRRATPPPPPPPPHVPADRTKMTGMVNGLVGGLDLDDADDYGPAIGRAQQSIPNV